MNESRIANKIVMAAAGPLTLLEQIQDDLRRGKLEDYRYLNMVGNGWGHTPGTDYIFGQAGEDIAYALIGFASGHKGKDEVLSIIRRNIQQALRDNEPFRGLRGEERATHELWMRMMKHGKAAGIKTAAIEEGDVCTVDMREAVSRELVAIVQDLVALEGTRLTLVRNPSTDEWIVKVFVNGKYDEGKTYYTDDKQDAINTMKQMKKEMGIIAAEEFPDTAEDIAWDVVTRMVNKRMSVDEALRNIGYGGLIRNTRAHEMPVGWESLPTEKMVKVMTPAIQRALNRSMSAAETFKCPNCGTKVLKNTGYCLKCKEKVKEAAGR